MNNDRIYRGIYQEQAIKAASNMFLKKKGDIFKDTIDRIRNILDNNRQLHTYLRDILEDAYDESIKTISALKDEIEIRRSQGKPVTSLTNQLNKVITHSSSLYSALAPMYQAQAIANITKPEEYLSEIVARINAVR